MIRSRSFRRVERLIQTVVALCLLAVAIVAGFAPFREAVLPLIPDDAFYYLEIARHMGSGAGSTFDGITKTNGYHPLWAWALIPLAHVMNESREAGARAAVLIGVLLTAGALYFIFRLAKRLQRSTAALAVLFPGAILCFSSNYGMESPLTLFLFAGLFWWEAKFPLHTHGIRTGVMVGLMAGLLVLSRIDTAIYVAVMDAVLLYNIVRHRGEKTWMECVRPFAACLVVQAALVGGYLIHNVMAFGHMMPISAMLKMARRSGPSLAWLTASWGAVPGVFATLLGIVAFAMRRGRRATPIWPTSVVGNIAYMAAIAMKAGYEAYHWYFALPTFCSGVFAAVIVAECHRRKWLRLSTGYTLWGAMAALLLAASVARRYTTPNNAVKRSWYDKAVWMSLCSPTSSVFVATDCGILAYFSHRSVINLDGLTSDLKLQEAMRDHRLAEHLFALGLNSLVTRSDREPAPSPDGTASTFLHTYPGLYGPAPRLKAELELVQTPECDTRFRLWKIRGLREEYSM